MSREKPSTKLAVLSGDPRVLDKSRKHMTDFFQQQRDHVASDMAQLEAQRDELAATRQNTKVVEKAIETLRRTLSFYERTLIAVKEGFIPMPRMEGRTILVLDTKEGKKGEVVTDNDNFSEEMVRGGATFGTGSIIVSTSDLRSFPLDLCKPELIAVANRAEAIEAFDELQIFPVNPQPGQDPILIGVIYGAGGRRLSFLITSWLNLNELAY